MPTYVFAGTTSLTGGMSTLTYGEALSIIAEPAGAMASPSKVQAETAARRSINWLQTIPWLYLQVKGSGIVIPANAETVDLPLPIRKIVSIKVGATTATDELTPAPAALVNARLGTGGALGRTAHYTIQNGLQRTGAIGLIDAWGSTAGVLDIWYTRPILRPTTPSDTLDLLEGPMENAFLDMASHYVSVVSGGDRSVRQELWEKANFHRREARSMDRTIWSAAIGMLPEWVGRPAGSPLRWHRRAASDIYLGRF